MSTIAHRAVPFPLAWRQVVRVGALTGVALTYAYALAFLLYAVLRATFTLVIMLWPDVGLLGAVIATSESLAIPVLMFATLLTIPAALLGAITAVLVYTTLLWLNGSHSPLQTALLGGTIALAVIAVIRFGLAYGLGVTAASLTLPTYLFWLGLPAAIYLIASTSGGWHLSHQVRR